MARQPPARRLAKELNGDSDNKLVAGQDVLAARPTLLLALALEGAGQEGKEELLSLLRCAKPQAGEERVARVRELYNKARVFEKAEKLVEKYKARAEAV